VAATRCGPAQRAMAGQHALSGNVDSKYRGNRVEFADWFTGGVFGRRVDGLRPSLKSNVGPTSPIVGSISTWQKRALARGLFAACETRSRRPKQTGKKI
jgi:hypothetical protein